MYGIIYKATNTLNGKVYIGQTIKTLKERIKGHKARSVYKDRRSIFQIALLDEGFQNFTWEQIDTFSNEAELDQKEKYWVDHYDARNPEKGYNDQSGGIHCTQSEETRRKMSEALKGKRHTEETRQKLKEINMGKHLSPETRTKISKAKKGMVGTFSGKCHSEETRRKLAEINTGKHHTEESRRKMSEVKKGKSKSDETRYRMSVAQKGNKNWLGKHHTLEARAKLSEAHRGEKAPVSKLTEAQVREIKIALANGETRRLLAEKYGVSGSTISLIKSGKNWGWLKIGA